MRLTLAALAALIFSTPAVAQDCAEGQRAFEHAMGETCIPAQPQRIVAPRHNSEATPLIDIGAPLVATGMETRREDGTRFIRGGGDIFSPAFIDSLGIVDLGDPNNIDMERSTWKWSRP
ncbi:MAG: hypothetical protein ACU0DW_04130 [Shimia sp.]